MNFTPLYTACTGGAEVGGYPPKSSLVIKTAVVVCAYAARSGKDRWAGLLIRIVFPRGSGTLSSFTGTRLFVVVIRLQVTSFHGSAVNVSLFCPPALNTSY